MQKYHNTIQDVAGNVLTGATVTIYDAGTINTSSIFEDDESTALSNPFDLSDLNYNDDGSFWFKAANGEYDISVSVGASSTLIEDVTLFDNGDEPPSASSFAGLTDTNVSSPVDGQLVRYEGGNLENYLKILFSENGITNPRIDFDEIEPSTPNDFYMGYNKVFGEYAGMFSNYGDFWLGVNGDDTTYINYFAGNFVDIGSTGNRLTGLIYYLKSNGTIDFDFGGLKFRLKPSTINSKILRFTKNILDDFDGLGFDTGDGIYFDEALLTSILFDGSDVVINTGSGALKIENGKFVSPVSTTGDDIAFEFDTETMLAGGNDFLLSIKNAGVEKFSVSQSGDLSIKGSTVNMDGATAFEKVTGSQHFFRSGTDEFSVFPIIGSFTASNSLGLMVFINGLYQLNVGGTLGGLVSTGSSQMNLGATGQPWKDLYIDSDFHNENPDSATYKSYVADGVSAKKAHTFDTFFQLTHLDSHIAVFKNYTDEVLAITKDGAIDFSSSAQTAKIITTDSGALNINSDNDLYSIKINPSLGKINCLANTSGELTFRYDGDDVFAVQQGMMYAPSIQFGQNVDLGNSVFEFNNIFLKGALLTSSGDLISNITENIDVDVNAFTFDKSNELISTGSNIASFKNGGVEKLAVTKDGHLDFVENGIFPAMRVAANRGFSVNDDGDASIMRFTPSTGQILASASEFKLLANFAEVLIVSESATYSGQASFANVDLGRSTEQYNNLYLQGELKSSSGLMKCTKPEVGATDNFIFDAGTLFENGSQIATFKCNGFDILKISSAGNFNFQTQFKANLSSFSSGTFVADGEEFVFSPTFGQVSVTYPEYIISVNGDNLFQLDSSAMFNPSAVAIGEIDLGTSTYKYKDLHLSGDANVDGDVISNGQKALTESFTYVMCEDTAGLSLTGYWSFGNGDTDINTGSNCFVPSGYECHIIAMTYVSNYDVSVGTIGLSINQVEQGVGYRLIPNNTSNKYQIEYATPLPLVTGDVISPKTIAVGVGGSSSQINMILRFRRT